MGCIFISCCFVISSLFVTFSVRMACSVFYFSTSIHSVCSKTKAKDNKYCAAHSLCICECLCIYWFRLFCVYFAINHMVFYWITHKAGSGSVCLLLMGSSDVTAETLKCMWHNYLKPFCCIVLSESKIHAKITITWNKESLLPVGFSSNVLIVWTSAFMIYCWYQGIVHSY